MTYPTKDDDFIRDAFDNVECWQTDYLSPEELGESEYVKADEILMEGVENLGVF